MSEQGLPPTDNHTMIDLLHRLRAMEQNLPPRVQTLEASVGEIRSEFREMRVEQNEQSHETRTALSAFNQTLISFDTGQKDERKAITSALNKMGRKITFASGALWAAGGLFALLAYNWQKFVPLAYFLTQGTPAP